VDAYDRVNDEGEEYIPEIPIEIRLLMLRANDLHELAQCGATYPYPQALEPEEWVALSAYQEAKRRFEERERKEQEEERDMREREQRLKGLTGRN